MARPKIETLEHRKAFDRYLALGADRSYLAVSKEFSVSEQAVKNWGKAFGWAGRVHEAETRIANRASAKLEESLADFDLKMIRTADAVIELFLQKIREAFDEHGQIKDTGWRPTALDAKIYADLKRELLAKSRGGEDEGAGLDADAVESIGFEQVERIVIERTQRLARFRKRGDQGSGDVGMAARPGDT